MNREAAKVLGLALVATAATGALVGLLLDTVLHKKRAGIGKAQ